MWAILVNPRQLRRTRRVSLAAAALILVFGSSMVLCQDQSQSARSGGDQKSVDSGFGGLDVSPPSGIPPQQIVRNFAAKESEFKIARSDYTYRRTVKVDTLDEDGRVDGEYEQVDDVVFSPAGVKHELVVYAPDNTLTRVAMSPADFDDLEHRLPFTLTSEDIDAYKVNYVGKQRVDQVATYVFDVSPKHMEKGHRYFAGRIWVDAKDNQIIVTHGKNIPDNTRRGQENLSPPFTTYRQQIDGKYWFPVYTRAEGMLHFQGCKHCLPNDVHIREIVTYADYKRFGSNAQIVYQGLSAPAAQSVAPPGKQPPSQGDADQSPPKN
ncbi:MAG TPA: hypothetical protein VFN53_01965 [Acidobacteriaceae bacterium]|nr:hypothetical protein [Acidobacteriaceae bacterium]